MIDADGSAAEVAVAASVATLVIEGGAFLLLFGPRLRLVCGALLLGLHGAITLINAMPYVGAPLLILLFCVRWRRAGTAVAGGQGRLLPGHIVILQVCMVVAAWALAPLGWSASLR